MTQEQWSYESLIALAAGELEGDARTALESQLAQSPDLQREFDVVRSVLRAMRPDELSSPRSKVIERAVALLRERGREPAVNRLQQTMRDIAELVFDSRWPAALAGFRAIGDDDGYHLTYASEFAEIDVQVKLRPDRTLHLLGQVAPLDSPTMPLKARLLRKTNAALADEADIDPRGMFSFSASKGEYDLIVEMDGRELVAQGLRLE